VPRRGAPGLPDSGGGRGSRCIACALGIAEQTVKNHVSHIYARLGAESRAQAVAQAVGLGLVSWPSNGPA